MHAVSTVIVVRFTAEGWHHWPTPTARRAYLGASHRHLFAVEVKLQTLHDDREVEFHDLLQEAREAFGSGDFGGASCEMLAQALAHAISQRYEGRWLEVGVFEDGEVGAIVTLAQPQGDRHHA